MQHISETGRVEQRWVLELSMEDGIQHGGHLIRPFAIRIQGIGDRPGSRWSRMRQIIHSSAAGGMSKIDFPECRHAIRPLLVVQQCYQRPLAFTAFVQPSLNPKFDFIRQIAPGLHRKDHHIRARRFLRSIRARQGLGQQRKRPPIDFDHRKLLPFSQPFAKPNRAIAQNRTFIDHRHAPRVGTIRLALLAKITHLTVTAVVDTLAILKSVAFNRTR